MVSWSGPVSVKKRLACGLDGTAPPVVTSIPIRLTGAVGDTLRAAGFFLLRLEIRLTVVFMTMIFVFRICSKKLGVLVLLQ